VEQRAGAAAPPLALPLLVQVGLGRHGRTERGQRGEKNDVFGIDDAFGERVEMGEETEVRDEVGNGDREMEDAGMEMDAAHPAVTVAAVEGTGMPLLRATLLRMAFGHVLADPGEAPVVTRERHARALRRARDELAEFLGALAEHIPMELAATHLRAAAGALEDLIGAVTVDDVLDRVFGDFCVGK